MKKTGRPLLMIAFALLLAGDASAAPSESESSSDAFRPSASWVSGHPGASGHPAASGRSNTQAKKRIGVAPQRQHNDTHLREQGNKSEPDQTHGGTGGRNGSRADQGSQDQKASSHGQPSDIAQINPGRAVPLAKAVPIQNGFVSNALSPRPPAVASSAVTMSGVSRDRDSNPPVIGGATAAKATNSAAINGTSMHRKP
jgi:hypothetical protein